MTRTWNVIWEIIAIFLVAIGLVSIVGNITTAVQLQSDFALKVIVTGAFEALALLMALIYLLMGFRKRMPACIRLSWYSSALL